MTRKKKEKATLYVEIDAVLKRRLARLAALRLRKITPEVEQALRRYLEVEEAREGLSDEADDA